MYRLLYLLPVHTVAVLTVWAMAVAADVALHIGYLQVEQTRPPTLSNLDPIPQDIGLAGARTGLKDNQTTGQFLGQAYTLDAASVADGEEPLAAAAALLDMSPYLLLDAPAPPFTSTKTSMSPRSETSTSAYAAPPDPPPVTPAPPQPPRADNLTRAWSPV